MNRRIWMIASLLTAGMLAVPAAHAAAANGSAAGSTVPVSEITLKKMSFRGVREPDQFGTVPDVVGGVGLELEFVFDRQLRVNEPIRPAVQQLTLASSNPQAFPVPAAVRIQANEPFNPYPFVVTPARVTQPTPVELTATFGATTRKMNFRVLPPPPFDTTARLYGSALPAASRPDEPTRPHAYHTLRGKTITTSVSVDIPAPAGGAKVYLATGPGSAERGSSFVREVTIPEGMRSAEFTVTIPANAPVADHAGYVEVRGSLKRNASPASMVPIARIFYADELRIVNVFREPYKQYPCAPGVRGMLVELNVDPDEGSKVVFTNPAGKISGSDFAIPPGFRRVVVPFRISADVTRNETCPIAFRLAGPQTNGTVWTDTVDVTPSKFQALQWSTSGSAFVAFNSDRATLLRGGAYAVRVAMTGTLNAPMTLSLATTGLPSGALPPSVTVPAGEQFIELPLQVPPSRGTAGYDAGIRATLPDGTTSTALFKVVPSNPPSVHVLERRVRAGDPCTLAIRLADPAPAGGQVVRVRSSSTLVQPPNTTTIPAGAREAFVPIPTQQSTTYQDIAVWVELEGSTGVQRSESASVQIGPAIRTAIRGGFVELASGRIGSDGTISCKFVRSDDGPIGWPVTAEVAVYDSNLVVLSKVVPSVGGDAPIARRIPIDGPGLRPAPLGAANLSRQIGPPKSVIRLSVLAPGGEASFQVSTAKNLLVGGFAGIKVTDDLAPVQTVGSDGNTHAISDDYADLLLRVTGRRDEMMSLAQVPRYDRFALEALREREVVPTDFNDDEKFDELRGKLTPLPKGAPTGRSAPVAPKPR